MSMTPKWTVFCRRCGRIKSEFHNCPSLPIVERFWLKVEIKRPDECWPWKAYCYPNGYGQFTLHHHKPIGAHVLSYMLTKGDPGTRLYVLHTCDNPPCCNPAHLFAGTNQDNMKDMARKGRSTRGRVRPGTGPKRNPVWISAELAAKIRVASGRQRDIARVFKVSKGTVFNIKKGCGKWGNPQEFPGRIAR